MLSYKTTSIHEPRLVFIILGDLAIFKSPTPTITMFLLSIGIIFVFKDQVNYRYSLQLGFCKIVQYEFTPAAFLLKARYGGEYNTLTHIFIFVLINVFTVSYLSP